MNREHMRLHLKTVFNPDNFREFEDGSFEIAYESKRGMGPNVAKRFALDEIDQAVDFAADKNQSSNIYIVSAVLYGECQGRSNASHFYASKFLVADVDEKWERTLDAVKALGLSYRLGVLTGSKPEPRVQVWFELDQVTDDIETIREAAPILNAAICGDANSIDTGTHLFRLAGTDSYPSLSKKAKGYAEEQIALKVHDSPPVNAESLLSLKPHPEYDSKLSSKIGKGGKKDGIQRDEDGKVIDGREIYWRSIVMAALANWQEDHEDAPSVDELFDECFPTFLDNTAGDDRWTSPDGQRALKQRVGNTLKRRASGRLKVAPKAVAETADSPDKADASAKINWMRLSDLAERPLKEREWTVDSWIPKGQVTLLYADGGVGKSQIILQLLTSVSLGENWFGLNTSSGSALYLGAEDDTDELHRRFHDVINARFKSYDDFPDVIFSSLAGEDALLANYDPKSKKLSPSAVMKELTAAIVEHKPTICVIDTLADVFPADENDRALARQFIGMLRKPAIEHKCALVVLAHPSLSGISTGRGTSGSTGWNNSVRSRITMERDEQNPDRRILKLAKSNYSKIGTEISISWENGVFVHDPHSSGLDAQAANSKARRVFLSLLESQNENGGSVNANGGSTHAPKFFAEHPMSEGVTKKAFGVAMKSLLAEGVIKSEETKRGTRLVVIKR